MSSPPPSPSTAARDAPRAGTRHAGLATAALAMLGSSCGVPQALPEPGAPDQTADTEVVLTVAAHDSRCPRDSVRLLATFDRHGLDGSALRFLVDGCQQRALYVERCRSRWAGPPPEGWHDVRELQGAYWYAQRCAFFIASHMPFGAPSPGPRPDAP